jgi:hypothetical protein
MTATQSHKHSAITIRAIRQRKGIPYEVEQRICADCGEILRERPVKRTAA